MKYLPAEYVTDVEVETEDGETVILHVWRNPETRNLVAIDNMDIELSRNFVNDPYNDEMRLTFHDTFSGLPT